MAADTTTSSHPPRRSLLGIGGVAALSLVLALGAVLEPIDAGAAAQACGALAVLAALCYGLLRTRFSARVSEANFIAAQLGAVYLILAWLAFQVEAALPAVTALYLMTMLYGTLQLDRRRLVLIGVLALVAHLSALLVLYERGHLVNPAAAWSQFGGLALAYAWSVYAAGVMLRVRARLAEAQRRLHDVGAEARERASRDPLTQSFNRGHVIESLEREIARAERIGKPLSVARVDLDWLGALNEAHGHLAGDVALRTFAQAATGALRDVDVLGRLGGKQFLVLMPDTDLTGAVIAAERVRSAVAREAVPEVDGRRNLSCTVGVAEHKKGENARLLLARAEAHLNLGKAGGRDRVVAEKR
ncbi:MAG TPA: GGDEF domain-containing protein [Burkholderiales bacterium]|nr:GGDEF domain-containing protein [Burkholderiales bacterium]